MNYNYTTTQYTSARQSNRANNSFNVRTRILALTLDERAVNPLISANKMLQNKSLICHTKCHLHIPDILKSVDIKFSKRA